MAEKVLYILYNEDDWGFSLPLQSSLETRLSFEEFYTFAEAQGWRVYRSNIDWCDNQTGLFSKAWTFHDQEWVKIENPPKPTAFFDKVAGKYDYSLFEKKMALAEHIPFINSPTFRTLFDNKWNQYLIFSEWMPSSFLAENQKQLGDVLNKISSSKAVVKLLYGSGGKEVTIGEKSELLQEHFTFPVIVQEFVSTAGVPGFSQKAEIADLRLVFIGDELVYALSRVAKEASLFTNFHQGATAVLVPIDKIPKNCLETATAVRSKISYFKKSYYSIDFMFNLAGEPIFIEINSTPGFDLLHLVGPEELRKQHADNLLALLST